MLEVISSDYVRTARAKGLPEDDVLYRHALRNGLLPFVTMLGLLIPGLIGGQRHLRDDLRVAGDRPARLRGDPGARLPGGDRAQLHRRASSPGRARSSRTSSTCWSTRGSACDGAGPRAGESPGPARLAGLPPEPPGGGRAGRRPRVLPDRAGRARADEGRAPGPGPARGAAARPAPGPLRAAEPRGGAGGEPAAARRLPLRHRRARAGRLRADAGGRVRVPLGRASSRSGSRWRSGSRSAGWPATTARCGSASAACGSSRWTR